MGPGKNFVANSCIGTLFKLGVIICLLLVFFFLKAEGGLFENGFSLGNSEKIQYKEKDRDKLISNIKAEAKENQRSEYILDHAEELSDSMLILVGNDTDATDFVYGYLTGEKKGGNGIENFSFSRKTPLYLQWDRRWGYEPLGDSVIGMAGCGPTSIAMALTSLRKESIEPPEVARLANKGGFMVEDGLSWSFLEEVEKRYGVSIKEIPLQESRMDSALEQGRKILVSVEEGDFTTGTHMMLLVGKRSGEYLLNDPNSLKNSKKSWSYKRLEPQIRNLWEIGN